MAVHTRCSSCASGTYWGCCCSRGGLGLRPGSASSSMAAFILYVPHIRKRSSSRFLSCDGPGLRVLIGGEGVVLATKCFLLRSQAPFWRAYVALLARPSLPDVSSPLACVKSGLELQVRATFALLSKKHSVYNPQQGAVKKSWGGLNALVARPPTTYTIMATSHHCRRLRARVDVALAGRSCH